MLSVDTKDFIEDLKNLEHLFDSSSLSENYELFSNEIKKVIGFGRKKIPMNTSLDEFVRLRSKMYVFLSDDDK